MRRNRQGFFLSGWMLLLTSLVAGCPGEQVKPDKEDQTFAKPSLEYRGISFENQSFGGMDVVFRFELINPDKRDAQVAVCPYELRFEGIEPMQGSVSPGAALPGGGKLEVSTRVTVPWPSAKDEVQALLRRKGITYEFSQTCNVKTPDGGVTVSAADSGSVPLPTLPELTVSGANAERFTGKEIRLNFELSFVNENTFSVMIRKIDYKITVEGKVLAEGTLPVEEGIPPSNEASYDITTGTLSGKESKEIVELIKKPSLQYHLEGMVLMGDFEIPVNAKGTISFPR